MIICHPLLSTWPPQKQETTLTLGSKPWKMDLPKEMSVRPVTGSSIIIRSIWAKNLVLFVWIRSDIIGVLKSETWPQFNAKYLFKESHVKQKEHWGSSRLTELYLDWLCHFKWISFIFEVSARSSTKWNKPNYQIFYVCQGKIFLVILLRDFHYQWYLNFNNYVITKTEIKMWWRGHLIWFLSQGLVFHRHFSSSFLCC